MESAQAVVGGTPVPQSASWPASSGRIRPLDATINLWPSIAAGCLICIRIYQPVFITWRLHDSLPSHRPFSEEAVSSGKAFSAMDRLLDETRLGPFYLRQPAIADMVVAAFYHVESVLQFHTLHAFVVMPNHVHLLVNPHIPLPKLTKTLKGYTAKQANLMLGLTGHPFWQEESYYQLVREAQEGERIRRYIEQNPVRAGLVADPAEYRWSSAREPAGRPAADLEVRPTS